MPPDVYTPMSLLRVCDIDAFADWLEKGPVSGKGRASVVPMDDFED
jgi:hypothetical protein